MDWRETDDPYRIWVSEIMLQQTRVETVLPYYRRFVAAIPTIEALAGSSPDEVMRLWEGLGYYSRARNLRRAAKEVVRRHGGRLPEDPQELAALPGIGRSTAGAIAAIAFRKDAPILDANAKRAIARIFAVTGDLSRQPAARRLWAISRALIAPGTGRETALALMDLGATVCTPRGPRCAACPLRSRCEGFRAGLQESIPARGKRKTLPHHDLVAAWVEDGKGRILVGRRPARGLLGGLWELPGGRRRPGESREEALRRELREGWGMSAAVGPLLVSVPHAFSHFRITLRVYRCRPDGGRPPVTGRKGRWAGTEDLAALAFPRFLRKAIGVIAPAEAGGHPEGRGCMPPGRADAGCGAGRTAES